MKKFEFKSYEDWRRYNCDPDPVKIGEYYAVIKQTWTGCKDLEGQVGYEAAISTYNIPTNVYAIKIYRSTFTYDGSNEEDLIKWYNRTVEELNEKFAQYIEMTYL